jgi:hypothetical protein
MGDYDTLEWNGWCADCGLCWAGFGDWLDCPRCGSMSIARSYLESEDPSVTMPIKLGILKTASSVILAAAVGSLFCLGLAYYIWRIING